MPTLPPNLGDLEAVIRRYSAAVQRREWFRSIMQDCYFYAVPNRELFTQQAPGQQKSMELFDSTAPVAVHEFASRIQSVMVPSWRQWSKLVPGPGLPEEARDDDELTEYLEEQTDIFFGYINHSNFVTKSHEAFEDLAIGTAAITLELDEQQQGFEFSSIPSAYLGLEEGPSGSVETVFRDAKCQVRHLERLYPGTDLPDEWQKLKDGKPETDVEYVVGSIFDPKTRTYWMVAFASKPKCLLFVRNLGETSPVIVFRWSVIPGETFGRGPVMSALPDIKTLNKVVEFLLRAAALSISPPLTGVTDGVLNPYTAQIVPGTVIPVMSNDQANPSLKPLVNDIRPELAQFVLDDMRTNVRRMLFSDPRRQEGPIQSATEVMIEDREFVQRIGAAFGRLQTEFIEKVINRGVHLLRGIGKMANFKVDGKEVTLKHLSPLARAQDQEELMSLNTAVSLTAPFGTEAVMSSFKVESIGEWIAKKAGVDAKVLRTDADRKAIAQKAQAALAAQAIAPGQSAAPAPPVAV